MLYVAETMYVYIYIQRERERDRQGSREREGNANKSIPHCKQPTFGRTCMSIQLTKPGLKIFLTSPGFCSSCVPKSICLTQNETLAL
jgi:hypothetical protein